MKEISKEDILELEKRRLIDSVTESVEKTLRKRYTWLAIIISFMIGGGVATAVISLTSSAQKKLIETEVFLERARKSVDSIDDISTSVKEKYENLNKDLDGLFAGKDNTLGILNETIDKINKIETRLNEMTTVINSISNNDSVKLPKKIDVGVNNTIEKIELSKYTIYPHYFSKEGKDKEIIVKLTNFLRDKGYIVPEYRKVKYQVRDIRYYHDVDKEGVSSLKNNVSEFLKAHDLDNIKLNVKDFGASYDNVRKGVIELWLYF